MEQKLLTARINNTADILLKTSVPKFLGFLSIEEAVLAERILSHRNVRYSFFGGYDGADRVVLACLPEWAEDVNFPIVPITFTFKKEYTLSHRDFLGLLMSLGIKRETIGDILTEESRAVIFVLEEIADYILNQVEKVGKVGVTLQKGFASPLPLKNTLEEFSVTVSSMRLDCVVAALCNFSRSDSAEKIELGLVNVNSEVIQKTTKTVFNGDVVSVRGKGKYIIISGEEKTRKNRLVLKYKKYV